MNLQVTLTPSEGKRLIGRAIAQYLERAEEGYEPFTPSDPELLRANLQPGDVLLVEGNNNISGIIKYLTQSTWSHAALYVGPIGERTTIDGEPLVLFPDVVVTPPLMLIGPVVQVLVTPLYVTTIVELPSA